MRKKAPIGKGTPNVSMAIKPPDNYQPLVGELAKKEKEGGLVYVLDEIWFAPGKMGPIHAGGKFVECNDGWFQAYNERGDKMFYRASPEIIKEVFHANE